MIESIDYKEIGLRAGLEVHQQLATERKLFCHCPAGLYTSTHDGSVLRHMRPTLSELGEYDGTALMEFKTKKNIVYLLHKSNVCTYEMDDTPPFLVNQEAIDVAIEQCLMLGCDIVDEVHIARKQYLDGSIPTGFQRTAIVGVEGSIPFRDRSISITQISVEEDSCREVSDKGHLIVWRTDRLGMPLIETVTGPDLRTPEEVEEAILLIGRVCRSTGHVRVGMGASRQDVNVSVAGGRRVEIKGVPKAGWAPALVHGEAVRQVNLLKLRDELHTRGLKNPEDTVVEDHDVTEFVADSQLEYFNTSAWDRAMQAEDRQPDFELGGGPFCVRVVVLRGLARTLSWPTQPDLTFAHELMGRVRVIACLDQQPTFIHSEKWPDYEGSLQEIKALKTKLRCGPEDALIALWGATDDTLTAVQEIRLRYIDALDGVPNETRQPMEDGSTDFERILPGPDRMYPDTDSPPQAIARDRVERLQATLPAPPWQREATYSAVGIPRQTTHYLIRRGGARLVDLVADRQNADLRWTCFFFGERIKALLRAGAAVNQISDSSWLALFDHFETRPALREAWAKIVTQLAETNDSDVDEVFQQLGLDREISDLAERIHAAVQTHHLQHANDSNGQLHRFLMGRLMSDLRGLVPSAEVAAALSTELEVRS
ncbi:MAG: Glu-tRNA(Gln) amidotransferase subunit GatE [bacterium]|nr:Glu-tRNA(Gln) amidotransferase subunit GatE [bacterium]